MKTAYDIADLGKRLEAKGLPVLLDTGEHVAGEVYLELKAWLKESAALSPNKIDDFVAPFLDQADPIILPQIDKINGRVG